MTVLFLINHVFYFFKAFLQFGHPIDHKNIQTSLKHSIWILNYFCTSCFPNPQSAMTFFSSPHTFTVASLLGRVLILQHSCFLQFNGEIDPQ